MILIFEYVHLPPEYNYKPNENYQAQVPYKAEFHIRSLIHTLRLYTKVDHILLTNSRKLKAKTFNTRHKRIVCAVKMASTSIRVYKISGYSTALFISKKMLYFSKSKSSRLNRWKMYVYCRFREFISATHSEWEQREDIGFVFTAKDDKRSWRQKSERKWNSFKNRYYQNKVYIVEKWKRVKGWKGSINCLWLWLKTPIQPPTSVYASKHVLQMLPPAWHSAIQIATKKMESCYKRGKHTAVTIITESG